MDILCILASLTWLRVRNCFCETSIWLFHLGDLRICSYHPIDTHWDLAYDLEFWEYDNFDTFSRFVSWLCESVVSGAQCAAGAAVPRLVTPWVSRSCPVWACLSEVSGSLQFSEHLSLWVGVGGYIHLVALSKGTLLGLPWIVQHGTYGNLGEWVGGCSWSASLSPSGVAGG